MIYAVIGATGQMGGLVADLVKRTTIHQEAPESANRQHQESPL